MLRVQIEVVKEFEFEAAHFLPDHPGKCKNLHGHSYLLRIGIKGEINPDTGMVTDFGELKKAVEQSMLGRLDHTYLNKVNFQEAAHSFPAERPTAERMVEWIVDFLRFYVFPPFLSVSLSFVRLYETRSSYVEWRAENVES